jgi:phosphoribosylaminoimidazolecarboxamide formyltransferase / IMP cyclohydrolase
MPRALLSVSNKEGVEDFARELAARGWTLLSTGGTARVLRAAGLTVVEVSEVTGHPEMMDGRVKTLHPAIHAGLLARAGHSADQEALRIHGYEAIDLVAVNLYPFRETIARVDVDLNEAIENIDIGGPAMLRASAKNHQRVWVVVDPADYDRVLHHLNEDRREAVELRRRLAAKVFAHTAAYDGAIGDFLASAADDSRIPIDVGVAADVLPETLVLDLRKAQELRYGENPDQLAALYADPSDGLGLPDLRQLHGKELSFNNLLDLDAALQAIAAWRGGVGPTACAIIKHTTPCGLAIGEGPADAYRKALSTDPKSAFGSVISFSAPVTEQAAILIRPNFVEAVVAPGFGPRALDLLQEKKNIRLIEVPSGLASDGLDFKRVRGGFAVQTRMLGEFPEDDWRVEGRRYPDPDEWEDLRFAWRAVAAVKSNAILIARHGMSLGIGAGQMSRVDASRIAVMKARDNGFDLDGAVLASDAFFPFRDGVDEAAEAGIRAVIQPGGSVRDDEVVRAADEHGIAMVFTGRRLFRH